MISSTSSKSPPQSPPTSPRRPGRQQRLSVDGHLPANPSKLREAQIMSPLETTKSRSNEEVPAINIDPPALEPRDQQPTVDQFDGPIHGEDPDARGYIVEPTQMDNDERTRLLESYHNPHICGLRDCNHGTFSPRASSIRSNATGNIMDGFARRLENFFGHEQGPRSLARDLLGDDFVNGLTAKTRSGASKWPTLGGSWRGSKWMYAAYYFPFLKWVTQYRMEWFRGDLVAALTMASFYIPMSLSYASNLGHIPPVNGLYAFVFNPIIYALLGTCPQMVVGPEAAGSLLVGQVVRSSIGKGESSDTDDILNAQIAGVVTSIAGAVILIAGITRLGFLDSVLSRPFLRGFISAIGFVILVDQAIPELGLHAHEIAHESTWRKLVFILQNIQHSHALTAAVSWGAFVIIMVFRQLKKSLQPRYPTVAYIPDRFLVVVGSAILAWKFEWDQKGLELLGKVKSSTEFGIPFHWPLKTGHIKHIDTALGTSILIALLGFFESSVAAKSLGEGTSGLQGLTISANRELIALGTANVVGGCFMALPAFGGYGRSKVNASTGGTTPMSSILLSLISLLCVFFVLPYFYWLPRGVLSAMISVVAYSLIEEAPHDIRFFIRIRGWMELSLMLIIFLSTILYSLSLGIALGIALSVLAVIKHAAKPRIQILGRVSGVEHRFENAEHCPENIEHVEGCLIVKIPEPLTFANTGDLRTRLKRLERYGTNRTHPSQPRMRHEDNNKNIIFDVHGVTSIDGSGTQVLAEIVQSYVDRGARVIFCRLPQRGSKVWTRFVDSGIIDLCGGEGHFVDSVDEALKLSEIEDLQTYLERRGRGDARVVP